MAHDARYVIGAEDDEMSVKYRVLPPLFSGLRPRYFTSLANAVRFAEKATAAMADPKGYSPFVTIQKFRDGRQVEFGG
jgi:hypothetical protein